MTIIKNYFNRLRYQSGTTQKRNPHGGRKRKIEEIEEPPDLNEGGESENNDFIESPLNEKNKNDDE